MEPENSQNPQIKAAAAASLWPWLCPEVSLQLIYCSAEPLRVESLRNVKMSFFMAIYLPGMWDVMKQKEIFIILFHYVTEIWKEGLM